MLYRGVIGGIVRWAYVLAYPTSKLTPSKALRLVTFKAV